MSERSVVIKKWGNSFGVIIPKEIVEKEHLKENEKITVIFAKKTNDLREIFGFAKSVKKSAQEIKDSVRRDLYSR